ncbi:MAG TPA: sarcosine oxidase subunit gamma family protein [Candidatus Dormibacteraeota bacterium]|nr:sarcosine oxidase subunit gamma family protein [Candidatus Dormibacteraeota bacterium]
MIAEAVRRSALADYADRFAALSAMNGGDVSIRELPFLSQINLRADSKAAGLMQQLESALGFALPVVPNTAASREDRRALWLGPDEWLVLGSDSQHEALEQALRNGLNGALGSIVDVSANRTLLEIRGTKARDLLAHGVPIDLDPRSFGPGCCAQTLLAKAQVIVERRDEETAFHLYVRSSFASYLANWLLDAAAE